MTSDSLLAHFFLCGTEYASQGPMHVRPALDYSQALAIFIPHISPRLY